MKRKNRKSISSSSGAKSFYPWPSHHKFSKLIDFSVRGKSHPVLKTCYSDDHIAQLISLWLHDIDGFFWGSSDREGPEINHVLQHLEDRVSESNDLRAAEILYAVATEATLAVLRLYLRHREIFDLIAPRRKILPSLFSIHPDTARVVARMRLDSRLGTKTAHARQVGSKAFFVRDAPANIYARAIIHSVEMNSDLEPIEIQQAGLDEWDRKAAFRPVVMPFPKYIKGIEKIPIPIAPDNVLQYWRKGKEIILEEMPDFHLRPEWDDYRNRRAYQAGRKKGAIRHAIFKDIFTALETIAGSNHRRVNAKTVTK